MTKRSVNRYEAQALEAIRRVVERSRESWALLCLSDSALHTLWEQWNDTDQDPTQERVAAFALWAVGRDD